MSTLLLVQSCVLETAVVGIGHIALEDVYMYQLLEVKHNASCEHILSALLCVTLVSISIPDWVEIVENVQNPHRVVSEAI